MVHSFDVMEFQEPVALNRPLVGRRTISFGHAALDVCSAHDPRCSHASLCRRYLFQPNQPQDSVGVTPRRSPTSLTDISPRACRSPFTVDRTAWRLRREQIRIRRPYFPIVP